jgi:hypothetical protein
VYSDLLACSNYRIICTVEMIVLFIEAGRNRSQCCFEIIGFINAVWWWNETSRWTSGKDCSIYMTRSCRRNWWLVCDLNLQYASVRVIIVLGSNQKGTWVQHSLIRVICDRHCYLNYPEFVPFTTPYIVPFTLNSPTVISTGMYKRTGPGIFLYKFEYP